MTERDLYDAALIEINKLEAPSMLLEDYNYYINKAIQQYINKVYNRYEINQQATDDLGALKVSGLLKIDNNPTPIFPGENKDYYCELPDDYWHMLSCIITFNKPSKLSVCGGGDSTTLSTAAKKMTSDVAPSIINNAYFKPSYKNPYYSINTSITGEDIIDDIFYGDCDCNGDKCPRPDSASVGKIMNIFCGDDSKCTPATVYINYLKTPKRVYITDDDLDGPDNTKTLEFPDYVCYEIINEFVKLLLENTADPRLSTNVPINQTIIPQITE